MSSHHIVREKQEPALLVLGLDNFPNELLGQLLEWSPTVITTPRTALQLAIYGIKIDWMITDGSEEAAQSDVKLMSAGNDNLTDAALKFLAGNEYPAVNIITDELDLRDFEPFANKIGLVIFHQHQKIFPVNPGFSKWKPAGEVIRILTDGVDLSPKGLQIIADKCFKTSQDGLFSLHFNAPFLFIAEEL